jgi:hypothetical protein
VASKNSIQAAHSAAGSDAELPVQARLDDSDLLLNARPSFGAYPPDVDAVGMLNWTSPLSDGVIEILVEPTYVEALCDASAAADVARQARTVTEHQQEILIVSGQNFAQE